MLLATYLKLSRVKNGLTQKEVADKLNYTTSQFISNWERGVTYPPASKLSVISDIYQIPVKLLQHKYTLERTTNLKMRLAQKMGQV
jgi:transcriptional regulator with XRE-family HTH domain